MATVLEHLPSLVTGPVTPTMADLLQRLGDIPPSRVLLRPAPGTATETDLLRIAAKEDRLCELVDGVLVEKAMGLRESILAVALAAFLRSFVVPRNLGVVSGEAGMMRLFPGLVRIPGVAFASWNRFPKRCVPLDPIPDLVPDVAVEVLSESNTPGEMLRKYQEYFSAGVLRVWEVNPRARTLTVYTAPDQHTVLRETDTLEGGDILPGLSLPLADLFAELDRKGN